MITDIISIFIGSGIGAVLRYIIIIMCLNLFALPILGTLSVNLIGCFLIGYVFGIILNKSDIIPQTLRLFAKLKSVGLIKDRREGMNVYYSLSICCMGEFFTCLNKILNGESPKNACK